MKIKGGVASHGEAVVDAQGRLLVDVAGAGGGDSLPEFISIVHGQPAQNIVITAANQNYEWTQVNFASAPAIMTLDASDELTVVTGGVYRIDWTLFLGWSAGTVFPFWVDCFQEVDEGGGGAWSYISGSSCANALEFDPGGGQGKISLAGHLVTRFTAADKVRLRIRRGAGAATTLSTDGSNGNTWTLTRIAD